MTVIDIFNLMEEIRTYEDLEVFQKEKSKEICKKYFITESQLNFLISAVASERIKENKTL